VTRRLALERVRTRDLFSRIGPEDVVDVVLASADGLRLGAVQRDGTVMFSDLHGFISVVESLTPAQVIDTLNHYLSEMSDAILNHGGTLVAYMGDGIMAVFGAPLVQANHAARALAAAPETRGGVRPIGGLHTRRAPAAVRRLDPRAGPGRGPPHGDRAQQRVRDVWPHRLRAAH
jgi:adenylate cyclase